MRCEELSPRLAEVADGATRLPTSERRHVEGCLRCQAELVQYRKVLRAMHAMRTELLEPAPGLVLEVLTHIEAAGERTAVRSMLVNRRVAYFAGLAAATAAGAAGAVIVGARSRRHHLAS